MQYEIVYEDGSHSVANYKDDEEALSAVQTHHNRATKGEPALLSDPEQRVKATRIVKVFAYDNPPGDLLEAQMLPADEVEAQLKELLKISTENDVVHVPTLAAHVRDLTNPFVDSAPHESNYKAEEAREVALPWLS